MKKIVLFISSCLLFQQMIAQNPLVTNIFTADPTARVFDGKLYVYPSHDIVPPEGIEAPRFCMPDYHLFSLENGNTWKDYGVVLDQNEVPWGKKDSYGMWAPDCIKKGDTYYYYYPAQPKDESSFRRIGVGTSKSPTGPFKWEKDYIKGVSGIDPGLLLDDDGKAYLYFGGGQELFVAPLKDNMKEIAAEPIKVEGLPAGYKEGSFPFKYNNLYYFTFAHVFPDEGYTIGYATSENPLGPFTYRGKIMDNINNGTNHHSVVNYNGQWILFYHYWQVSGYNKLRSMSADYMEFKKDGAIKKVKPTMRGIGSPTIGEEIQVDRYNEISGAKTAFVGGNEPLGWMVCDTKMMSTVQFNNVDFADGSATKMEARIACGQRIGSFEVRIGNAKGKLIANFPVKYTGGWNTWKTIETPILEKITGKQNIVVLFKSDWGSDKTVNLNWLKLK
ncbi:Carbohydrate binding module (family 6) [Lutibacter agarilyticus]|uniref:Carbohydrate binding module (Family 6) n=1 Tax=Lutibacter agarilyticus TaxID=1109740 RepID=A0A238VBB2_9FLAO|nr:family 43 glycosylhydrolase [Lutibacter agarilyticus]SNR31491.1 Carbohydrate binding module (family 6) [Lutibacter agarilyticus]